MDQDHKYFMEDINDREKGAANLVSCLAAVSLSEFQIMKNTRTLEVIGDI